MPPKATLIVQVLLSTVLIAANFAYWFLVATRGERWFRRRCERRFNVTIVSAGRGMWRVTGEGSWLRRFCIEWLQLVYFMTAFILWAGTAIGIAFVGSKLFPWL